MKISSATRRDNGKMVYLVQSETDVNHWHIVWREADGFHCSCKSFKFGRKHSCKHTNAVKMEIWMAMDEVGAKWMPPMKIERQRMQVAAAAIRQAETVAARAQRDAYGERAGYIPGDYYSHAYR